MRCPPHSALEVRHQPKCGFYLSRVLEREPFVERSSRALILESLVVLAVFIWSAIRPHDYFTWVLEVFPAIIGALILATTYRRFRFTTLVYVLIAVHMVILMIGGHYTYAEVPLGNWIRDQFGLSRNHYDRLGHFAQGFVPAMIAREVLLRLKVLKRGRWLIVFVVSMCLAVSALYELIEWVVSALTGSAGDAFLGTQGDVFDTQKDMAMALVGALTAVISLSKAHDKQLAAFDR
jgi:putative membrane protein